jgi:hypothetical protein
VNPTQDTVPNPPRAPEAIKRHYAYGHSTPWQDWHYARHRRVRADLAGQHSGHEFSESLSSIRDGTLYVGNLNLGGVVKVAPAGKAEQFIAPGAAASRSVLGVLVDEKSSTLYVCPTI